MIFSPENLMLLAITVVEISSGQTDKQTNRQTDKRDRKQYLSDFIGGGKKKERNKQCFRADSDIRDGNLYI